MANRTIIETTHTYNEFVEIYTKAPRGAAAIRQGFNSAQNSPRDWTGTANLEEAYKLAIEGYDSGIKQLELDESCLIGAGTEFNPSVAGAVVNIGAYLQGLPENMYELSEEREYNLEPVTVYVNLVYCGGVSLKQAMEYCQSTIKIINELQAKHNVRIVGVLDVNQANNVRSVTNVIIKDFDERMVLNNIAFAFHPSFFRRLWFRCLETKSFIDDGYGSILGTEAILNRIKKDHSKTEKAILTPSLDYIGGGYEFNMCHKINYDIDTKPLR